LPIEPLPASVALIAPSSLGHVDPRPSASRRAVPEGSVTSLSRGAVNYGALGGWRQSRRRHILPPRTHRRPSALAGSARFERLADVLAPGVPPPRLLADGAYDGDMSEDPPIAILEPAPRMMIAVNPGEGGGDADRSPIDVTPLRRPVSAGSGTAVSA
jgi:hypothetical protein